MATVIGTELQAQGYTWQRNYGAWIDPSGVYLVTVGKLAGDTRDTASVYRVDVNRSEPVHVGDVGTSGSVLALVERDAAPVDPPAPDAPTVYAQGYADAVAHRVKSYPYGAPHRDAYAAGYDQGYADTRDAAYDGA